MVAVTLEARAWFRQFVRSQIKPRSAVQKETQLNHFARYLGREPLLADFTVESLEASTTALIELRSWTLATAAKYKREMAAMWSAAARTGHASPAQRLATIKATKTEATAWSESEVDKILFSAELLEGCVCGIPLCDWMAAKLRWLHNSGARHNETLSLRQSDFDLDNAVARIPGKFRKNGKPLAVTLLPGTVEALRKIWHQSKDGFVWPWPYQVRALDCLLRRLLVIAGLRGDAELRKRVLVGKRERGVHVDELLAAAVDRRDLWHKWRRTFATHAYCRARDIELVKRWLDHSDLKVTYGYIDWTQVDRVTQRDVIRDPSRAVMTQLRLFETGA